MPDTVRLVVEALAKLLCPVIVKAVIVVVARVVLPPITKAPVPVALVKLREDILRELRRRLEIVAVARTVLPLTVRLVVDEFPSVV